jgi:hypothetical protein
MDSDHRADIERITCLRLVRANPSLTQHDIVVAR